MPLFKRNINLKDGDDMEISSRFEIPFGHSALMPSVVSSVNVCPICGQDLFEPMHSTKAAKTHYAYCGKPKCRKEIRKNAMFEKLEGKSGS